MFLLWWHNDRLKAIVQSTCSLFGISEPMEQREPSGLHEWPSRDRGRRSQMHPILDAVKVVKIKMHPTFLLHFHFLKETPSSLPSGPLSYSILTLMLQGFYANLPNAFV